MTTISEQIVEFVRSCPKSTAADIAKGVDSIESGDHASKFFFALHKRGALMRSDTKPFRYSVAPGVSVAATAPDQPEVSATTPAADEGITTTASSAPRAGRAPARAAKPAAGKRVSDRIESWCVWHDGEVHLLCPDGNTWTLDKDQLYRIAGAIDGMEGV